MNLSRAGGDVDAHAQSPALAAAGKHFELWDRRVPFPAFDEMPDLDVVTHVSVETAERGGYRYLHDTRLACYRGVLHVGWANHRDGEVHFKGAIIRGSRSADGGLTWSAPETWAEAPLCGAECFNHRVLAVHQDRLWGFFTCWNEKKPRAEIFTWDGAWKPCGASIPDLVPFQPPLKMRDGNWIMAGEGPGWDQPAVVISRSDDFRRWDMVHIPRPAEMKMDFAETALLDQGDRLVAVCRPREMATAPVSVSTDCGRTWEPLHASNFPLAESQPCAGQLSTGQHFLITNNLEEGRTLLSIAVTAPGARTFSRIWKIRHQSFPKRRFFPGVFWRDKLVKPMLGTPTEWSYPSAVEHDGNLYVSYTRGKEDCALSIVPVRGLATT